MGHGPNLGVVNFSQDDSNPAPVSSVQRSDIAEGCTHFLEGQSSFTVQVWFPADESGTETARSMRLTMVWNTKYETQNAYLLLKYLLTGFWYTNRTLEVYCNIRTFPM